MSARATSEERQDQRAVTATGGAAKHPAPDPLFGADLPLSAIQSTVAKLTLKVLVFSV